MKKTIIGVTVAALILTLAVTGYTLADNLSANFESPSYSIGSINGQDGWIKTGAYDVAVVANTYNIPSFGNQVLRISDAITSGSFGDQTFSKPLVNEAGESDALNGGQSGGARQPHFEAQFDIASVLQTLQPGMHISVSPDRGDGARMSYLRFEDQSNGIHVFFDDVQGETSSANFVETDIATIDRAPHTIKISMDFVDGPSNDVVKVYIDGVLRHTGTSWENYYRFDPESNPTLENKSRTVDSLLFRESGTANPANQGNGFLIDNLSLLSSAMLDTTAPAVPTHLSPANNSVLTQAQLTMIDWSNVTDPSTPVVYYYESSNSNSTNTDGSFSSPVYQSGALSVSEIPTSGTPEGEWYWHVRAVDNAGNSSAWSTPWHITVDNTPVVQPTAPSTKNECMNNGWTTFSKGFKNQGQCVSYVQANDHAGKK